MLQLDKTRDYLIQALILYTVHRSSKQVYFKGQLSQDIANTFLEHEVEWTQSPTKAYDTVIFYEPSGSDEDILREIRDARPLLAEGANLLIFGREIKGLEEQEAALVESVPSGEHLYVMADHITKENIADKVIWVKMRLDLSRVDSRLDGELVPMDKSQTEPLAGCYFKAFQASLPDEELTLEMSCEYIQDTLSSQEQPWIKEASFTYMQESNLIGAVLVTRFEDKPLINQLITSPDYWGQGIGRRLMVGAIHQLKLMGETELILYVLLKNIAAKRLYESLGFLEIGRGIA